MHPFLRLISFKQESFTRKKYFMWLVERNGHFSQTHSKEAFPPKKPFFLPFFSRVDVDPHFQCCGSMPILMCSLIYSEFLLPHHDLPFQVTSSSSLQAKYTTFIFSLGNQTPPISLKLCFKKEKTSPNKSIVKSILSLTHNTNFP